MNELEQQIMNVMAAADNIMEAAGHCDGAAQIMDAVCTCIERSDNPRSLAIALRILANRVSSRYIDDDAAMELLIDVMNVVQDYEKGITQ